MCSWTPERPVEINWLPLYRKPADHQVCKLFSKTAVLRNGKLVLIGTKICKPVPWSPNLISILHANTFYMQTTQNQYSVITPHQKCLEYCWNLRELKETVTILLKVVSYTPKNIHVLLLEATHHFWWIFFRKYFYRGTKYPSAIDKSLHYKICHWGRKNNKKSHPNIKQASRIRSKTRSSLCTQLC